MCAPENQLCFAKIENLVDIGNIDVRKGLLINHVVTDGSIK